MTPFEAVRACEFWTTNVAETLAIFSTRNAEMGEALNGLRFHADRETGSLGWAGRSAAIRLRRVWTGSGSSSRTRSTRRRSK